MTQLHDIETFISMDYTKLTKQERVDALMSLVFLVEKRGGRFKERGCTDGLNQREKISKEDATSPTVAFEIIRNISAI